MLTLIALALLVTAPRAHAAMAASELMYVTMVKHEEVEIDRLVTAILESFFDSAHPDQIGRTYRLEGRYLAYLADWEEVEPRWSPSGCAKSWATARTSARRFTSNAAVGWD